MRPALSHDGSRIAFQSLACDLVCEGKCDPGQRDINLLWDVFVHDRSTRRTIRASAGGGDEWMENSRAPSLDDTGDVLVFGSRHPINGRDEAHDEDLYIVKGSGVRGSAVQGFGFRRSKVQRFGEALNPNL